ncbi:hypothetical protein D0Z07_5239 [Hyphodiscus hymeniophilus]|uniref:Uncharacterized protein n=1 Tax=Hyphodiscus hymeniophilus TaxID=353542 RepID=A0A9P7AWJ3_9HELO|nr:hypothetical protein D0Z07_5239 [Hyphodiscus hymeniophilus]
MFDLPDAKWVRRSDLYKRSQSASPNPSEPDPHLEAELRARLASIYGPLSDHLISGSGAYNEPADFDTEDRASVEHGQQEFEFRLFSTSGAGRSVNEEDVVAQKVLLNGDDEEDGDGGFVVKDRNRGYYFAEKAFGERQMGFEIMALSGNDVLSRARRRAWGLEVPWRVRVLHAGKTEVGGVLNEMGPEEREKDAKRRRPGKKRRITLRQRQKLRQELQQQKKAEMEAKEEAEREKRTRRNREKKVKKKMKEKAKKADSTMEVDSNGTANLKEYSSVAMKEIPD